MSCVSLLGHLTVFVCSRVSLDEAVGTWGRMIFPARMTPSPWPEQQSALANQDWA